MEILLLFAVIGGNILNIFVMKRFFSQLREKLIPPTPVTVIPSPLSQDSHSPLRYPWPPEPPLPNEVSQINRDEIEFDENVPFEIPKDVKFEVEGGDSHIPPGFEGKN